MRACDFCKRPVVDDAAICPHPGCGKPLAGAGGASAARALKRPPPPGRVTAPIPIKDPAGIAPQHRGGGARPLRLALAIAGRVICHVGVRPFGVSHTPFVLSSHGYGLAGALRWAASSARVSRSRLL